MKLYMLKRQQVIRRSREDVFKFFEQAENLERVTPKSVGFRILTPMPIRMEAGTILDYVIHLMGFPVRWTTCITEYEPPERFADVALRGPYAYWHHTHTFEPHERGTLMIDEVHYALPLGWLGRLVRRLWVRRELERIFDYRARVIGELLGREEHSAAEMPETERAT